MDSNYTRNDDIVIRSLSEVKAFVWAFHGFAGFPLEWELVRIPDIGTFDEWFGIP